MGSADALRAEATGGRRKSLNGVGIDSGATLNREGSNNAGRWCVDRSIRAPTPTKTVNDEVGKLRAFSARLPTGRQALRAPIKSSP